MKENRSSEIILEVKLEENDLYRFNLKQTYNNIGVKLLSIAGGFYLIYLPGLILKVVMNGLKPPIQIFFFVFVMLSSIYIPFSIKKSTRKVMETNKFLQQLQQFRITDKEILVSSESGHAQITWDKVFEVREEKYYFAIYISKVQAYLIPKRYLMHSKCADTFRNIVRNSTPPVKHKLKVTT